MKESQTQPPQFDAYASGYEDLLRDPLRVKFTRSNEFFFERKVQVIREFYQKIGVSTANLSWLDAGCGQGDLLRDAWTTPRRIPLFHVDDGSHHVLAGYLWARLPPCRGQKQQAILPSLQCAMEA